VDILQEEEATAKAEAERPQPGLTMFTMGHDLTMEPPDIRLPGRTVNAGWASNPHGLQPGSLGRKVGCLRQGAGNHRKATDNTRLQASPIPRPSSSAWPQRNLAPVRCIRSRPEAHRNTSRARPDITTESDGAQPTRAPQETNRLMSGPNRQRTKPIRMEWNGCNSGIGTGDG